MTSFTPGRVGVHTQSGDHRRPGHRGVRGPAAVRRLPRPAPPGGAREHWGAGRKLGITAQGVSKVVIEMERKGYVQRTPDPRTSGRGSRRSPSGVGGRVHDPADPGPRQPGAAGQPRAGATAFLDQIRQLAENTGALAALK